LDNYSWIKGEKMKIPIYQIDAFTNRMFHGNPAAVCVLNEALSDELMQNIAEENNLAETAFILKTNNQLELRWFMPTAEIDLCGHGTLAAAFVLWECEGYNKPVIDFMSKEKGIIRAEKSDNGITIDLPIMDWKPCEIPDQCKQAFTSPILEAYEGRDLMLVFESEDDIRRADPDIMLLKELSYTGINITAEGDQVDFVSRVFDPHSHLTEDPVTGSAHCQFVPYWAMKTGKKEFHAVQLSKRMGELFCTLADDRVLLRGNALCYLKGEIFL
jgi:PhzF family phenazine biosynthesis protein